MQVPPLCRMYQGHVLEMNISYILGHVLEDACMLEMDLGHVLFSRTCLGDTCIPAVLNR